MNTLTKLPADRFLDQAISALVSGDNSSMAMLANSVSTVAKPVSVAAYLRNRGIYLALLEETGRNLRLLLRAAEQRRADFYISGAC